MEHELSTQIIQLVRGYQQAGLVDDIAILPDTILYGSGGLLGSLMLITLVVELETILSAQWGYPVSLASDRMFSQVRTPFRTVETLSAYISSLKQNRG